MSINKLYNIWVKNENTIPATYGNVSFYTQAKADINKLTTTALGVGCADPSINHILDVSGNQRVRGTLDICGNMTMGGTLDMSGDITTTGNAIAYGYVSGTEMYCISMSCSATSSFGTTKTDVITFNGQLNTAHYPVFNGNTAAQSVIGGSMPPLVYYQDNFVRKTGNAADSINGNKTFTGDVSFNTGALVFQNGAVSNSAITINNASLTLSNSSLLNPTAIRMNGSSIQTNGGIFFQSADLNRKLTLWTAITGECGSHSIGVNTTGTNMQFMVPDINRKYTFSYGTGASTKTDILTIDASATSVNRGLVMRDHPLAVNKSDGSKFFFLDPTYGDAYVRGSDFAVRGGGLRVADISDNEPSFSYGAALESVGNFTIYDNSFASVNRRMVVDVDGLTLYKGGISSVGQFAIYDNSFASVNLRMVVDTDGLTLHKDGILVKNGGIVCQDNGVDRFSFSPGAGDFMQIASNFRIYDNSFSALNIAIDYAPEYGLVINRDTEIRDGTLNMLMLDGSTNLLFGNPQGTITSKTSKHWYTAGSLITTTFTVPKPWDEYYGIDISGAAYTITLPTITDIDAGNPITFRKVRQTGASFTISFISNGTQRLFNNSLAGSTTAVGIMTGTVFYFTLVPMWDETQDDWGWFRVV